MEAAKYPFKTLELVETSPQTSELSPQVRKTIAETLAAKNGKTRVEPAVGHSWYELERLIPYRDLLFVVGFALVVAGVSRWMMLARMARSKVAGGSGIWW